MKKAAEAEKKQAGRENKAYEKAKNKSQAIDFRRLRISNSQGVRSFKNILSNLATGFEPLDTAEPKLSTTAKSKPFNTTKPEPSNTAGPEPAGLVVADFLRTSHFEKVDSQLYKPKMSLSSIFATNTRLSNSKKIKAT